MCHLIKTPLHYTYINSFFLDSLPPMWIFQVRGSQKKPFVPKHTAQGYRLEQKQKQPKNKK